MAKDVDHVEVVNSGGLRSLELDGHGLRLEVRADGGEAERNLARVPATPTHYNTMPLVRLLSYMERAVVQDHAHVGDWVPGQCVVLEPLEEAVLERWDVVAWHVPAHHDALDLGILPRVGVHLH